MQATEMIKQYNLKFFPDDLDHKKLQIFVNRLVVTDELNKLRGQRETNEVYVQALEKECRYYKRYSAIISGVFLGCAALYNGLFGVWEWSVLTLVTLFMSA
jgi:hypothetical protein